MTRFIKTVAVTATLTWAAAVAHADDNLSMGAEYEMNEGVIAYTKKHNKITPMYPENSMNERFLCSTEQSAFPGWPLISFTHDMGWANSARTLEIVLGPVRDGDRTSGPKQSTILQAVYRALNKYRTTSCNESVVRGYCFVSLQQLMTDVPGVTDRGCGGDDFVALNPRLYHPWKAGIIIDKTTGYTSEVEDHVATQITLGIKRNAFVDMSTDSLFGKSKPGTRTTQRAEALTNLRTLLAAKFGTKTKDQQSLVLYATYAITSFLANRASVTEASMGGDGFHAPSWKNAFVLYPKTSIVSVLRELASDATITADSVYDAIKVTTAGKGFLPARLEADFKALWNEVKEADSDDESPLEQAKPASGTEVLLLEVRSPASKAMTITNGGDKDSMTMTVALPGS